MNKRAIQCCFELLLVIFWAEKLESIDFPFIFPVKELTKKLGGFFTEKQTERSVCQKHIKGTLLFWHL